MDLKQANSSLDADADHALDGFLRAAAAALQPYRHTPLHFQIDSAGAAWQALTQAWRRIERARINPALLASRLSERVTRLLAGEPPGQSEWDEELDDAPADGRALAPCLAPLSDWVTGFHQCLRSADAAAIEVFAMHMQGCSRREIAAQLCLGLRLVDRLWARMQELWAKGAAT